MKISKRLMLSTACIGAAWFSLGAADIARADATDDLLQTLVQKGILTQQEYEQLKSRKAAEAAAAPPPAAFPTPQGGNAQNNVVTMMDKGIGVHVGSVDVTVSGELNAFYVYDKPDTPGPNKAVDGGLAGVGTRGASAVRNGLLPNNFNIDLATVQNGINIDAHFGIYPGLNSSPMGGAVGANGGGNPVALGTSGIDFRQQYLTVGTDTLGTFKFGRDIGLYGQEAILNDFTLFGVGSASGSYAPGNTSLGRIGVGYIYADFMPQITYTSPSFNGFTAAVGMFQPLDTLNFSGLSNPNLTHHDMPQFQGKLAYKMPDNGSGWSFKAWTNVVTQQLQWNGTGNTTANFTGYAWDFGGKVDFGPAELTGTGYIGNGAGTTGLFFDAVSPGYFDAAGVYHAPASRDSSGFYVQGSYTFADTFTFSASYGDSHLDLANSGEPAASGLLVKDNESYDFGLKYKLTSWVDLIGEFAHTTATAHNGNQDQENSVAAGAIAFF
jgi:predicted porin